jgi:hypothetical protein
MKHKQICYSEDGQFDCCCELRILNELQQTEIENKISEHQLEGMIKILKNSHSLT